MFSRMLSPPPEISWRNPTGGWMKSEGEEGCGDTQAIQGKRDIWHLFPKALHCLSLPEAQSKLSGLVHNSSVLLSPSASDPCADSSALYSTNACLTTFLEYSEEFLFNSWENERISEYVSNASSSKCEIVRWSINHKRNWKTGSWLISCQYHSCLIFSHFPKICAAGFSQQGLRPRWLS